MSRRVLGRRTGIEVAEVGIGTWELSGDVWGAKDDSVSRRAVLAGVEAGATFVDTAADYGQGHVEELLGAMFGDGSLARDRIVLATKVRPECMEWAPPPHRPIAEFFRPEWIRSECEASLRRLQTDHVDVLFLHTWSRAWAHEEDWFGAMAGLKEAGKVRAIGISIADEGVADANVAIALGQVDVIQTVYSVFQQEPEATLFPLAEKHGVGIVARSPFSSGALVQKWQEGMEFPAGDWRATWPQEKKRDWVAEQARMADAVGTVMAKTGLPKPAFCLRYVLDSPAVSVVIPGSANPDHVRSNVEAPARTPALPPEVHAQLARMWREHEVHATFNGSG